VDALVSVLPTQFFDGQEERCDINAQAEACSMNSSSRENGGFVTIHFARALFLGEKINIGFSIPPINEIGRHDIVPIFLKNAGDMPFATGRFPDLVLGARGCGSTDRPPQRVSGNDRRTDG